MLFIEVHHDYGVAYISRQLLSEAKHLYVESSYWNDTSRWYVRASGDVPEMIFNEREDAMKCYEYLKGFIKD